jgi:hypothetical protein
MTVEAEITGPDWVIWWEQNPDLKKSVTLSLEHAGICKVQHNFQLPVEVKLITKIDLQILHNTTTEWAISLLTKSTNLDVLHAV